MLSKIKGLFNRNNKKTVYFALLFFLVFVFSSDVAFAITTPSDTKSIDNANVFFVLISVIIGFFSQLIGILISPEFTTGSFFGGNFTKILHDLWILISNVVYFIFAFILVWIAFMNILGKEGAEYELKQALPKFIVGVLLVPFSRFIVNFVISISIILTTSVIGLAYDTMGGDNISKEIWNTTVASKITIDATSLTKQLEEIKDKKDGGKINLGDIFKKEGSTSLSDLVSKNSIGGIMAVYTYSIMKLDKTNKVYKDQVLDGVKSMTDIILKLGIDFIFLVVYGLLLIAVGIALFIRGIYLWLFMIFSPIFGLLYFFGDKGGETLKKFNFKEFINLALVPVYVAGALSFGLMFILITATATEKGQSPELKNLKIGKLISGDGGVELTIKGNFAGNNAGKEGDVLGFLGDVTGRLFINIIALVVLWLSVMAALKSSEITGAAIQPIADFGKSMGDLMQNAPKYVPILPGGQSMTSLSTAGGSFASSVKNIQTSKGSQLANKWETFAGVNPGEMFKKQQELLNKKVTTNLEKQQHIRDTIKGVTDNDLVNSQLHGMMFQNLVKGGLSKDTESEFNSVKNTKELALFLKRHSNELAKGTNATIFNDVNQIQNLIKGTKSTTKQGKGDNVYDNVTDVKAYVKDNEYTQDNNDSKIYIKRIKGKDNKDIVGQINVILEENGGGGKLMKVKLTATGENDSEFIGDDLNEAKELLSKLGEKRFRIILDQAGFNNIDGLIDSIGGGKNHDKGRKANKK